MVMEAGEAERANAETDEGDGGFDPALGFAGGSEPDADVYRVSWCCVSSDSEGWKSHDVTCLHGDECSPCYGRGGVEEPRDDVAKDEDDVGAFAVDVYHQLTANGGFG